MLFWLSVSEHSPLRGCLPAMIAGMAFSGNVHQPNEIVTSLAVCAQWYGLGYVLGMLVFSYPAAKD